MLLTVLLTVNISPKNKGAIRKKRYFLNSICVELNPSFLFQIRCQLCPKKTLVKCCCFKFSSDCFLGGICDLQDTQTPDSNKASSETHLENKQKVETLRKCKQIICFRKKSNNFQPYYKHLSKVGVIEMTHPVRVLAAKSDKPEFNSCIPHGWRRTDSQMLLSDLYIYVRIHINEWMKWIFLILCKEMKKYPQWIVQKPFHTVHS